MISTLFSIESGPRLPYCRGMKTPAPRCHGVIENMPQDLTDSPFDVGTSLSYRIADKLGWSRREVHKFSLLALRDLVRPVSPKLAHEITVLHESGRVLWRQSTEQ